MSFPDIKTLNDIFGVPNQLVFMEGPGKLPLAKLCNEYGRATVSLYGAHVIEYQPHEQPPVLWLSPLSRFEPGKAIRGGIPVCWPWFSDHPTDKAKPAHGFARASLWQVASHNQESSDVIELRLTLTNRDVVVSDLWPHPFSWEIQVQLGRSLSVGLKVKNTDDRPITCSGALHSYFHVSDARRIQVKGLEECRYVDLLDRQQEKTQVGAITFDQETDRVYGPTTDTCMIDDPLWQRRIAIAKQGSRSTVVWNPWIEKSNRMADMPAGGYLNMVCVETTNAAPDVVTLNPGEEHRLSASIQCQTE